MFLVINYNSDIETVSAKISMDLVDVEAGADGIIKSVNVKNFDRVKLGQTIAEVVASSKNNSMCSSDKKNYDSALKEYENSAVMYKDGVISKEEYDSSLVKYKNSKTKFSNSKNCSTNGNVHTIFSKADGIILLTGNYNKGDFIYSESVIGTIRPEKILIKAYFSPKIAKKIKINSNAEITIIKYPEKQLSGVVKSVDGVDVYGQLITLEIKDDIFDMDIANDDAAIVKIIK